jgi:hypothetical protein
MFLGRFTTDVTLTFFHAWLKTFPTFPSYPTSVTAAGEIAGRLWLERGQMLISAQQHRPDDLGGNQPR